MTYEAVGYLTNEALDHWDDTFDQIGNARQSPDCKLSAVTGAGGLAVQLVS